MTITYYDPDEDGVMQPEGYWHYNCCDWVRREDYEALEAQLAELREVVQEAFDCEMIPKSSASDGGASKYSEQVMVADRLRAALQEGGG